MLAGDIRDAAIITRLLDGCDAVIHAAGVVGTDRRREALMWEINAHATEAMLTRAAEAGLDPIVSVSSYSALFPPPDGVITADTPPAPGRSPYAQTKAYADRAARTLQAQGAPVVVTYPSSVVGPAFHTAAGVTERGWAPIVAGGAAPRMPGGMQMVDVRDVAEVHRRLMRPGNGPRRYVCGGVMVSFNEMIDTLERGSGKRIRRIPLSPNCSVASGGSPMSRAGFFRWATGSATRRPCCSPRPPRPMMRSPSPTWAWTAGVHRSRPSWSHSGGEPPTAAVSSATSRSRSSGESASSATVWISNAEPAAMASAARASTSAP